MFHFRIIACGDGTDIIDTTLKTPYESLTPSQMMEYTEMEKPLAYMERMGKKEQREAGRGRKIARNLLNRAVMAWIENILVSVQIKSMEGIILWERVQHRQYRKHSGI